jgi:hypothetical protein
MISCEEGLDVVRRKGVGSKQRGQSFNELPGKNESTS